MAIYIDEVHLKRSSRYCIILLLLVFAASNAAAVPGRTVPAKAAVVLDSSGAVLFSKYPNAKLAPASTVKLVTAMVAIDNLKTEDVVKISTNASKVRTIPPGICPEEELAVIDLLHLALMKSINSAAVALAEAAAGTEDDFVVLMNRKAQEIGARDTLFANASGLPKGKQYSTANDLALIMKAALTYPVIRDILTTKAHIVRTAAGREIFLENSNHLLWEDQTMIIGKTGYTGNARHCFVGAMDTGHGTVITAVLGARSRTSLWRATSMLAEVGANPELANLLEAPRHGRAGVKPGTRKSRTPQAAKPQEPTGKEIHVSRLLRISPQQLGNN